MVSTYCTSSEASKLDNLPHEGPFRLVAELELELADSEINTDEVGRKEDRYDSDDARASNFEGSVMLYGGCRSQYGMTLACLLY